VLIAAALMSAAAVGVWLRYSAGAVIVAYELGRRVEAVLRRSAR